MLLSDFNAQTSCVVFVRRGLSKITHKKFFFPSGRKAILLVAHKPALVKGQMETRKAMLFGCIATFGRKAMAIMFIAIYNVYPQCGDQEGETAAILGSGQLMVGMVAYSKESLYGRPPRTK